MDHPIFQQDGGFSPAVVDPAGPELSFCLRAGKRPPFGGPGKPVPARGAYDFRLQNGRGKQPFVKRGETA
jgi:hypothetical protein